MCVTATVTGLQSHPRGGRSLVPVLQQANTWQVGIAGPTTGHRLQTTTIVLVCGYTVPTAEDASTTISVMKVVRRFWSSYGRKVLDPWPGCVGNGCGCAVLDHAEYAVYGPDYWLSVPEWALTCDWAVETW